MKNSLLVTQFNSKNLKSLARQFGVDSIQTRCIGQPSTNNISLYLTTVTGHSTNGTPILDQDILMLSNNETEALASKNLLESINRAVNKVQAKIGIRTERTGLHNNLQKTTLNLEKIFKHGCIRI